MIHQNWDDLRFFLTVAEAGSFHVASQVLTSNRTTVARRLERLERDLCAKLFDRTAKGLVLTAAGRDLLPHVVRLRTETEAAYRALHGRDQSLNGPVTLSMPHFLAQTFVMELLTGFCHAYPQIDLRVDLNREIASLDQREADLSLRYAHEVTDNAIGRRLVTCVRAVYCAPKLAGTLLNDGGIGQYWIGSFESADTRRPDWIATTAFPKAQLRNRMNEAAPMIAAAKAGLGLCLLPCFVGDKAEGLVRAPYQKICTDKSLWLLLHRDLSKMPRVRVLADHIAEGVAARRSEFQSG